MSKRTSAGVSNGSAKDSTAGEPGECPNNNPRTKTNRILAEDKQKRLLQEDGSHFSLIKAMHLADLITELNGTTILESPHSARSANGVFAGFCGVMSVFSAMRYCLGPPTAHANLWAALAFMPFGLFFDFMDGKVARWRKKSSLMGQELDSLADLVGSPLSPTCYFC